MVGKKKKNNVGKGSKGPVGGPVLRAHQLLKCYVNQPNQVSSIFLQDYFIVFLMFFVSVNLQKN